ncbi:MAG: Uma2 family endonuclease [Acidobacteria bacterium]|nr:Uma2 family endonuclease [Acidobacteriota bacterium]
MSVRQPVVDEWVYYPETDGKPMAESDTHRDEWIDAIVTLRDFFRSTLNVYVTGNILLYYQQGDARLSVAPDLMVVKGVRKGKRRSYKLWEEGKGPDMIIEFTSRASRFEDVSAKKQLYERVLQVPEYFLFDPEHEYLEEPLMGYRLVRGRYRKIRPVGPGRLRSEQLELELVATDKRLRFYDPVAKAFLPTPADNAEARRAMEEKLRVAEKVEERLRAAETELDRLRAEVKRLRSQTSGES